MMITARASKLPVFVIPTDEELMIAQHALRLMREVMYSVRLGFAADDLYEHG